MATVVRSYVVPSNDSRRTDAVVNHSIAGEDALAEGFVLRYGEARPDGRIELVTYGEGNAALQPHNTGFMWRGDVDRVRSRNAREIFGQALGQG